MIDSRPHRDDNSLPCCVILTLVFIFTLFTLSPSSQSNIYSLHWNNMCFFTGRRLHSGHSGHHSAHYINHFHTSYHTYSNLSTTGRAVSLRPSHDIYFKDLIDISPYTLPDNRYMRYTILQGCHSFQYNASQTFYVADSFHSSFNSSSCYDSFYTFSRFIWILYPTDSVVYLNSCGSLFILDSRFKNYAFVHN